jgi:hypothetical protein
MVSLICHFGLFTVLCDEGIIMSGVESNWPLSCRKVISNQGDARTKLYGYLSCERAAEMLLFKIRETERLSVENGKSNHSLVGRFPSA